MSYLTENTIGEIRLFAGDFAPRGWALCNGQILPISLHNALYATIGPKYGGDARTTFALPDLRDRAPLAIAPGGWNATGDVGRIGTGETRTVAMNYIICLEGSFASRE